MKTKNLRTAILLLLLLATIVVGSGFVQPGPGLDLQREQLSKAVMEQSRAEYRSCFMQHQENINSCDSLRQRMVVDTKGFTRVHYEIHHH